MTDIYDQGKERKVRYMVFVNALANILQENRTYRVVICFFVHYKKLLQSIVDVKSQVRKMTA
jgi:hypothetical protein